MACDRMPYAMACADDLLGPLTYRQVRLAAIAFAEEFRRMPCDQIAVLLPASVGAMLVVFAIQLAGKTPVMLNWTLGPKNLDVMAKLSGVTYVISSWRFMERISHVDFGSLTDKILLLEDIRERIPLSRKLLSLYRSYLSPKKILHHLGSDLMGNDATAVILFTSGAEATPKGVPLTHDNILSDLRAVLSMIELNEKDIMYGVLPPFHSFGFSMTGVLPFLAGLKVAFYPDPTDSVALAEGLERWKITLFSTAPSFLKGVFQVARDEQLKTVHYFVTGAEKAPPELYKKVSQLKTKAQMLEGYGITECSPVLSLTPPDREPKGVGRLLPNVNLCIIHPETHELLLPTQEGEICVRGPNVFHGYLGKVAIFIEIDHKSWYRTGDIGYQDAEGNLILSGRLKRFVKVGGEMISLGAIEEAVRAELIRQNKISPDIPSFAICADERESGKPSLVAFSTSPLKWRRSMTCFINRVQAV